MYNIDLLKGSGIPSVSRPSTMVLRAIPFLIPAVAAVVIISIFVENMVTLRTQTSSARWYDKRIQAGADMDTLLENYAQKERSIHHSVADLANNIQIHMPCSPILVAMVENLPETVVLDRIQLKRCITTDKIVSADQPGRPKDVISCSYGLHISVNCPKGDQGAQQIQTFVKQLRNSDIMSPIIEDIQIGLNSTNTNSKKIVQYDNYTIQCIFKKSSVL